MSTKAQQTLGGGPHAHLPTPYTVDPKRTVRKYLPLWRRRVSKEVGGGGAPPREPLRAVTAGALAAVYTQHLELGRRRHPEDPEPSRWPSGCTAAAMNGLRDVRRERGKNASTTATAAATAGAAATAAARARLNQPTSSLHPTRTSSTTSSSSSSSRRWWEERAYCQPVYYLWCNICRAETWRSLSACISAIVPLLTTENQDAVEDLEEVRFFAVGHSLGWLIWWLMLLQRLQHLGSLPPPQLSVLPINNQQQQQQEQQEKQRLQQQQQEEEEEEKEKQTSSRGWSSSKSSRSRRGCSSSGSRRRRSSSRSLSSKRGREGQGGFPPTCYNSPWLDCSAPCIPSRGCLQILSCLPNHASCYRGGSSPARLAIGRRTWC
ncbi:hypothetical protein ACSSS7_007217 [Eimeria intestinalis]